MEFKECVDCPLSLICFSDCARGAYCSSLDRHYLVYYEGDPSGGERIIAMMPDACPKKSRLVKSTCFGDRSEGRPSRCGACKVTVAVLREKLDEERSCA